MNTSLFITFIILNAINVVLQTVKSIATVKGGKMTAALMNAISYGYYTIVVVYMVSDLPLMVKVLVVGACNLVGVYFVKYFEERSRKDKLWKIEATVNSQYIAEIDNLLHEVPHSYLMLSDKHTLFCFYCSTQAESQKVKEMTTKFKPKYFVAESKIL